MRMEINLTTDWKLFAGNHYIITSEAGCMWMCCLGGAGWQKKSQVKE